MRLPAPTAALARAGRLRMLRCGTSDKRHSDIAKDVQNLSRTPANNKYRWRPVQCIADTEWAVRRLYSRTYAGRKRSGTAAAAAQALLARRSCLPSILRPLGHEPGCGTPIETRGWGPRRGELTSLLLTSTCCRWPCMATRRAWGEHLSPMCPGCKGRILRNRSSLMFGVVYGGLDAFLDL